MKAPDPKTRARSLAARDPYRLYEIAVQSPEHDAPFIDRVFQKRNGRLPRTLREDFCGTANLSSHWVRARHDNRAVAVDHDPAILEWGRAHNILPLGEDASRAKLVRADVRNVRRPKVDVVAAFNYSYFVFKERRHLLAYCRAVRASLRSGGVFVLDIFGGYDTQTESTDTTRHDGFTHVWEQKHFDPLTNRSRFVMHFELDEGPPIRNAFSYDWRMWSVPELRDVLTEAGFRGVDVYWEGIDPETGEGEGVYRLVRKARNTPGWNALIVAS
jgi:SAM-dependent methyltransferase